MRLMAIPIYIKSPSKPGCAKRDKIKKEKPNKEVFSLISESTLGSTFEDFPALGFPAGRQTGTSWGRRVCAGGGGRLNISFGVDMPTIGRDS